MASLATTKKWTSRQGGARGQAAVILESILPLRQFQRPAALREVLVVTNPELCAQIKPNAWARVGIPPAPAGAHVQHLHRRGINTMFDRQ
jgi:hypothetical protein